MLLKQYLVLVLVLSDAVESNAAMTVHTHQAVFSIQEQNVFNLDFFCFGHYLVPVGNEISYDSAPIVTSRSQQFGAFAYGDRVAAFLVLLHYVAAGAFCILRGILVMDIYLDVLTN